MVTVQLMLFRLIENRPPFRTCYEEKGKTLRYAEFNRYALKRAFNDINGFEFVPYEQYLEKCTEFHKTDIHFWYEPIRSGPKGEVKKIKVYIRYDNPESVKAVKKEVKAAVEAKSRNSKLFRLFYSLWRFRVPNS